jgi:hypothetical protein
MRKPSVGSPFPDVSSSLRRRAGIRPVESRAPSAARPIMTDCTHLPVPARPLSHPQLLRRHHSGGESVRYTH